MSFNYDVVFEYSLPYCCVWHYAGVDDTNKSRPLPILKPHGSINWEEVDGEISVEDDPQSFPTMPIIVAPTHLKFIGTGESAGEWFGNAACSWLLKPIRANSRYLGSYGKSHAGSERIRFCGVLLSIL